MKTSGNKIKEYLPWVLVALFMISVPAVIVRVTMQDVPVRSEIKVITWFSKAATIIEQNFKRHQSHQQGKLQGRISPLPADAHAWIELINPNGRKAPGGGPAFLLEANEQTGAIGLSTINGDVVLTIPAYRGLEPRRVIIQKNGATD